MRFHKAFFIPALVLSVLIAIFAGVSLYLATHDGATYDEIAHIGSGYAYLTQHDYRLNPEHPPILKVLSAIPLLFIHPTFNITKDIWSWEHFYDSGEYGQWDAGRYLLYDSGNNGDYLLFWARVPFVIMSVLFALFLFLWVLLSGWEVFCFICLTQICSGTTTSSRQILAQPLP